ncbi:hypothetical protein ACFWY5_57100 [Nonomuraea sp. NPDC059007]|uniref:hypothetical protein n=1 Tax=Nonomuraea sp. NPDC059007 TaxID=3346692 RepID=UPI0036BBAA85
MSAVRLAAFPLVVTLSKDSDEPIKIRAKHKVAGMLPLYRNQVRRLDRSWNIPGTYVLLDRPDAERTALIKAGKHPRIMRADI